MPKNYYVILGLTPGASLREIKGAYRQMAKEYHPDHYGADNHRFMDLQEAYAVLSNAARRQAYDKVLCGLRVFPSRRAANVEPIVRKVTAPEPLIPKRESGCVPEVSLTRSFETFSPSFDEIFDRLWDNFSSMERPKAETLKSLRIEVPLSPFEADRSGQVRVMVPARSVCPTCGGRGGIGLYACWRCAGEGAISGEFPLLVSFPRGLTDNHRVKIALDRFGVHNFYLLVHFRITEE